MNQTNRVVAIIKNPTINDSEESLKVNTIAWSFIAEEGAILDFYIDVLTLIERI